MHSSLIGIKTELNQLYKDVIGLVWVKNRFEFILHTHENGNIDTISITSLGVIHECYNTPSNYGIIKYFPNNKTMIEMLDTPKEYFAFLKSFD